MKTTNTHVSFFGYLSIQSALLFFHYGLKYAMPWWVTWFPSVLVMGFIATIIGVILVVGLFVLLSHFLGKVL